MMDFNLAVNVIATGLIVVFLALILLIIVMMAMGAAFGNRKNEKKKASVITPKAPETTPVPATVPVQSDDGIEEEVVAVITAAISAMMAESGNTSGFVIKNIRRTREARPAWSMAGLQQNTKPF